MKIFEKVKKLKCLIENGCKKPEYSDVESAGMDLFASEDADVFVGKTAAIGTGFHINIPKGYVGMVKGRSGLAFKSGILGFNGVIDCGYSGEVKVLLFNAGDTAYKVNKGDKIGQIVFMPFEKVKLDKTHKEDEFMASFKFDRGGGFGHSGK